MTDQRDAEREPKGPEEALVEARRAKAARVRERGENPFANELGEVDAIGYVRGLVEGAISGGKHAAEAVEKLAKEERAEEVHVAGRVMALRSTGGLSFAKLRDATGEIQLMLDQSTMGAEYARLEDIDVGDFVHARGKLTASKRGELSVLPGDVRLVTKAYRPLPEKWHGLQDVELRYRQRYVDLVANPDVADVFRARSHVVRAVRAMLDERGFLEVETPTMHPLVGGAAARPFTTHHNALDMKLYMRIAPELYLKRLLVGGLDRVYEIGRCYRNEGISTRHNPEFTMLEFYQAYATYDDLMDFTEVLLRGVDERLAQAMPDAHDKWLAARPFTLAQPFVRLPMEEAVASAAERTAIPEWVEASERAGGRAVVDALREGFGEPIDGRPSALPEPGRKMDGRSPALPEPGRKIREWAKSSPRAKAIDWGNLRKSLGKCDNDGERLFACYEYLVEPFLPQDYRCDDGKHSVPVFIKDYPYEVSPLARRNDRRPELVERFELFVHGRELCNAFSELNDPDDQADRFRAQVEKKARGDEESMDYDEDYVRALEHGMPPAAGFGMGVDRLVMALTNAASIRDVIFFPLLRPDTGQGPSQ